MKLNFTVTNPLSVSQTFLQWGTPFEGVSSDMFEITDEQSNRLKYLGKIVLRGEIPIEEEFITLPAGGAISTSVNLGENYEFLSTGKFIVRVDLPEYCQLQYSATDSNIATVFQLQNIPKREPIGAPQGYTNCDSSEISYSNAAVSGGRSEAAASYNCLNADTCSSSYTKWFGAYSLSNYNYVSNCYYNVYTVLNNYPFNGYCDGPQCSANTYAYVYPSDSSRTVYLCSLFFSRTNERNRVIVHEMSHFSSICGTQDYTYGETNCLALARSNPNQACRNADNICYFASIG